MSDYVTDTELQTALDNLEIGGDETNVWVGKVVEENIDGTVDAKLLDENNEIDPESETIENISLFTFDSNHNIKTPVLGYVVSVNAFQQTCTVKPYGGGNTIVAKYYIYNPEIGNTVAATFQNEQWICIVVIVS